MLADAFMMTEGSQSVADPAPAQIQAPASPVTVPRQAVGGVSGEGVQWHRGGGRGSLKMTQEYQRGQSNDTGGSEGTIKMTQEDQKGLLK